MQGEADEGAKDGLELMVGKATNGDTEEPEVEGESAIRDKDEPEIAGAKMSSPSRSKAKESSSKRAKGQFKIEVDGASAIRDKDKPEIADA